MNIWIDNTTLHGVARCLAGRASVHDVDTFLQFASELVFADRIYYSTFEAASVQVESESVRADALALGLDPDVLRPVEDVSAYRVSCLDAATHIVADITAAVGTLPVPDSAFIASVEPDLRGHDTGGDAALVRILSNPSAAGRPVPTVLQDYRSSGATLFMLAESDELWNAIRALPAVGDARSLELVPVVMRLYLNEQLARHVPKDAKTTVDYAPAAPRAALLTTNGNLPLKALDRLIAKTVERVAVQPLPAPSVAEALLQRADAAEPRSIIAEAIAARAHASALRKYLITASAARERSGDFSPMIAAINQLERQLLMALGVEAEPNVWKAFDIQVFGSIPAPLPNPNKLTEVVSHKITSGRVLVLSEFVKSIAWRRIDPFAREKLVRAASKNAGS